MNKSEELEQKAFKEDNDIKAFALLSKSLRETRSPYTFRLGVVHNDKL